MSVESHRGMVLIGENRRTRRKTCPSATFSTTNRTYTDPGANEGLHGERTATNRLSHGTVIAGITIRISSNRNTAVDKRYLGIYLNRLTTRQAELGICKYF
jgi:hypothetical protein